MPNIFIQNLTFAVFGFYEFIIQDLPIYVLYKKKNLIILSTYWHAHMCVFEEVFNRLIIYASTGIITQTHEDSIASIYEYYHNNTVLDSRRTVVLI